MNIHYLHEVTVIGNGPWIIEYNTRRCWPLLGRLIHNQDTGGSEVTISGNVDFYTDLV